VTAGERESRGACHSPLVGSPPIRSRRGATRVAGGSGMACPRPRRGVLRCQHELVRSARFRSRTRRPRNRATATAAPRRASPNLALGARARMAGAGGYHHRRGRGVLSRVRVRALAGCRYRADGRRLTIFNAGVIRLTRRRLLGWGRVSTRPLWTRHYSMTAPLRRGIFLRALARRRRWQVNPLRPAAGAARLVPRCERSA
jgi:hypothetical protein